MQFKFELEGGNFSKAGYASSQIKKVLKQLSVDPRIIKRVVVALYEAEVNVVAHAWRGTVLVEVEADKIIMQLQDEGPGIQDIEQAMREGYSTASPAVREMGFGAGMGLPNMKKNVDELNLESKVGVGTTVRMMTWFSKPED
ncbi:MAG: Serine/threonine-protein kinase RsbT [Parabacteroides sp.]|jgi:anti-sigma F factor